MKDLAWRPRHFYKKAAKRCLIVAVYIDVIDKKFELIPDDLVSGVNIIIQIIKTFVMIG